MFGQNEIQGRKFFQDMPEGHLAVTTIFPTLQGEGPFTGQPAVFIRLSKCNLRCSFCDTFFDHGEIVHYSHVAEEVRLNADWREMGVVITGGEPLLQKNVVFILKKLVDMGFKFVQIETNGTLFIDELNYMAGVTIVCSPKCLERGGVAIHYLKPHDALLQRADFLKFVISADVNSPYYGVPEWARAWQQVMRRPVYVSPMNVYKKLPAVQSAYENKGRFVKDVVTEGNAIARIRARAEIEIVSFWENDLLDMEQNKRNHEHAAQYALNNGLRLSLQQHLYASLP
jgi:organic radical activating enzyme